MYNNIFPYGNPYANQVPNLLQPGGQGLMMGQDMPNLLGNESNQFLANKTSVFEPVEAKKLFIKGFPPDMPNDMVEKLLKEFGPLQSFKRTKGATFGHSEFENLESVTKCIRLLHNRKMHGKDVMVKSHEKGESLIRTWKEQKEQEWQQRRIYFSSIDSDKTKDDYKMYMKYESFEKYLERDDDKLKKKLDKLLDDLEYSVNKHKIDRQREEERKEHPRERDREARKKQYKKELDRKYEEKLKEWMRKEQDRDRERQRDREREAEREKNFQRNLEREANYDSEEERRRVGKQRMLERKKFRQREYEEDELERKREMLKYQKPPEPSPPPQAPQEPAIEEEAPDEVNIDDEDQPEGRQQQDDNGKNEQGNQNEIQQLPQLKDEQKEELKKIYMQIPSTKEELFSFTIDWALFAKSNLLEKKVRPWLGQKCKEYLGQEEKVFIDAIIKRLLNKESPQNIVNKVLVKILEEDSEEFVIKMWKFIIFELMKLEKGITT